MKSTFMVHNDLPTGYATVDFAMTANVNVCAVGERRENALEREHGERSKNTESDTRLKKA